MNRPECLREDCKSVITSFTISNPIQEPTFIIECSTCDKKWKGTIKNDERTYEELK
jgi:hypothetical protein